MLGGREVLLLSNQAIDQKSNYGGSTKTCPKCTSARFGMHLWSGLALYYEVLLLRRQLKPTMVCSSAGGIILITWQVVHHPIMEETGGLSKSIIIICLL